MENMVDFMRVGMYLAGAVLIIWASYIFWGAKRG